MEKRKYIVNVIIFVGKTSFIIEKQSINTPGNTKHENKRLDNTNSVYSERFNISYLINDTNLEHLIPIPG